MQNMPPHLMPQSPSPMQGMPPMEGQMMEGMGNEEEQPQKIVAHMSPEETHDLDEAQGGAVFDPETGLRDYTPLDSFLKIPEIREAIVSAFSQEKQKFAMGGEVEGRPNDPELEKLRMEGRHGDTELVIITPDLLEFFSELAGHPPHENPHTGLPEFGGVGSIFKGIARIAAPMVGFMFGGPIGAAVAGTGATKLTGGTWKQSLTAGALSGLGAFAAPQIGGMVQGQFPGFSAGMGQATRGIFGQNVGGALGNLFTPSGGGGIVSPHAVVGANTIGKMLPGSAFGQNIGQAGLQAAGQSGGGGFLGNIMGGLGGSTGTGGGGGGGILGSLLGSLGGALPLIGSGLLMNKGHKEEQKSIKEHQRALEAKEQREKQEAEAFRERMGFNAKLNPLEPYRRRQVNPDQSREDYLRGIAPSYFENYAEGGAIRGDGKGQQDNIPKKIKENSFIIDASTVSDIGDGSSEAGIKDLDRFFSKIHPHRMKKEAKGGYIDALVSNQEYEVSPEEVTAIGRGSNQKGAQILKKFVQEIRATKRTSGKRLPPKSKPIGGYLKGINMHAA